MGMLLRWKHNAATPISRKRTNAGVSAAAPPWGWLVAGARAGCAMATSIAPTRQGCASVPHGGVNRP